MQFVGILPYFIHQVNSAMCSFEITPKKVTIGCCSDKVIVSWNFKIRSVSINQLQVQVAKSQVESGDKIRPKALAA